MLTSEENELLTRIGPSTAGGDLLRRYWQPAALLEELPPGGAPIPVTLMGEELVLFRDEHGQPGLLGLHCSHRGADLSYGRIEDGGLRCLYHGWLFDRGGRCLEQPGEPAGSTFHERIKHPSYPCVERAGVIFAYLGPGEPPLFPNYDFLMADDRHVISTKLFSECNYLQANEGNIDSVHLSFLHRMLNANDAHLVPASHAQRERRSPVPAEWDARLRRRASRADGLRPSHLLAARRLRGRALPAHHVLPHAERRPLRRWSGRWLQRELARPNR
jgi:phenylpropionate dioxygenase-like ring-hydroxylating dioxygenase large terminal subunit